MSGDTAAPIPHEEPRPARAPGKRRRGVGLRARTAVALGGISVVIAGVLGLFTFERVRSELVDSRETAAEREAYANARVARSRLRSERSGAEVLDGLVRSDGAALLRLDGEWYSSTVGIEEADVPAVLRDLVVGGGSGRQRVLIDDRLHLVTGVPLASEGAQYFEIADVDDLNADLDRLRETLVVGVLGAGLLGIVLGALVSGQVLRPLQDIGRAARMIRRGELNTALDAQSDPTLDAIVDEFNAMVGELRERIERDERFTSDVTHELRGRLASLQSAVAVAERGLEDRERRRVAMEALRTGVEEFNAVVADLLEISRIEAGAAQLRAESSDPAALVRSAMDAADEHPPLVVAPDVPDVVAVDRRRIAQVLINLLENARRYGDGPTGVHVSVDGAGHLRLIVEDCGPGVPSHERTAVFERFHRGSTGEGVAGGSGLGLALAAEHVRLHRGRIWVEDGPGGGARFVVELPLDLPVELPAEEVV